MSNYKSLDFAKKNQKFHKFFGRNLDITDCSVSGVSSNSFKNFCVFVAIEAVLPRFNSSGFVKYMSKL